tara:strand:+ start:2479 stop:3318 length:840 start_codon:yes stop_codon:yes gene_type:complete
MAQVKLDISEYELMKENAKLLKESLLRERELSDENDALQREKLQIMEDGKMMVTVVNKTRVTTTSSPRVHESDMVRHIKGKMARAISEIMKDRYSNNPQERSMHRSSYDHMRNHHDFGMNSQDNSHLDYVMKKIDFRPGELHSLFYGKEVTITNEGPKEVTLKGLDQVSADMKSEAYEMLTKKAANALDQNPIISQERHDANYELEMVSRRLKLSKSLDEKKSVEIEELKAELSKAEFVRAEENGKIDEIYLVVSGEKTIFGNKKKVTDIKQILNRKDG